MKPELSHIYHGPSGLDVYGYRGYEVFVSAIPGHGDLPGYYPKVSFNKEGEPEELFTPTLTYTLQRRRESMEEAAAFGLELALKAIDEIEEDAGG